MEAILGMDSVPSEKFMPDSSSSILKSTNVPCAALSILGRALVAASAAAPSMPRTAFTSEP